MAVPKGPSSALPAMPHAPVQQPQAVIADDIAPMQMAAPPLLQPPPQQEHQRSTAEDDAVDEFLAEEEEQSETAAEATQEVDYASMAVLPELPAQMPSISDVTELSFGVVIVVVVIAATCVCVLLLLSRAIATGIRTF